MAVRIRKTLRNCGSDRPLDSQFALVYEAVENGKTIGCIRIDDTGEGVSPYWSWVDKEHRGRGVGTELYEAAARGSCRVFKAPLRSASKLSEMTKGFWEKQLRKGRADCELHVRGDCVAYSLRCPAPSSLAAAGAPRCTTLDHTIKCVDDADGERGYLFASLTKARCSVADVFVRPKFRNTGVATGLYEAVSRECWRHGLPLRSGYITSDEALGFWRKQVRKGRASRIETGTRDRFNQYDYVLDSPPPSSLAAPPYLEPMIQAKERDLVKWKQERGVLFDKHGRVVLQKKGTKHKLSFDEDDLARFPDRYLTHNHPGTTFRKGDLEFESGSSLSPADVYVAAKHNLAEVRVVTTVSVDGRPKTIVYRMERPSGGWPESWRIRDAAEAASARLKRSIEHEYRKGKRSYENTATSVMDETWKQLAPELGLRYSSTVLSGALVRRRRKG